MKFFPIILIIILSIKSVYAGEDIESNQHKNEIADEIQRLQNLNKSINNNFDWEVEDSMTICKIEESIGFIWKENKYTKASFKPEILIFQRIGNKKITNDSNCRKLSNYYNDFIYFPQQTKTMADAKLNRCYSITKLGEKAKEELCTEYYLSSELQYIECGQNKFKSDGLFLHQSNSRNLKITSGEKPDIAISHGLCTKP